MKKPVPIRRTRRADREEKVLLGLIEVYIRLAKPVGSNTLREHGFRDLSSATIRNYFAQLERAGFLQQQHASGGRIPTARAYQLYADHHRKIATLGEEEREALEGLHQETKEIAAYLQAASEQLAQVTGLATFLAAPRFDHDFVLEIKLIALDATRCLCVMLTDFGSILTEVLPTEHKLSAFMLKRMEHYFAWRLTGQEVEEAMREEEAALAQRFYNELMVRYITRYSSFTEPDLFRTGFSNLLSYPEFKNAAALANGLSLFESPSSMRALLHDCERGGVLRYWIGSELTPYVPAAEHCGVIAIPYRINQLPVGAIGLLGPMRLPYPRLFGLLSGLSDAVSEALSKSLHRYRIQYRQPTTGTLYLPQGEQKLLSQTSQSLLEEQ